MIQNEIYLDNAASTPVDPRVLTEYVNISNVTWGNPSNIRHHYGKKAKDLLENSRFRIGHYLGLDPRGLIFTSGATEANNLAIRGIRCLKQGQCSLVISAIEHPCVEAAAKALANQGVIIKIVPVLPSGIVDLNTLYRLIIEPPRAKLVSIMTVNNETGVVQPIEQITEIAHRHNALVHTDATQAIGKISLNNINNVDMLSFSSHKINGPKGIGALWIRPNIEVDPILLGGGQEFGLRSGTVPVPLIAALAKATEVSVLDTQWLNKINIPLREMERKILQYCPVAKINGIEAPRIVSTVNISFPYQTQIIDLVENLAISSGSACSCNKNSISPVLSKMGIPQNYAHNNIRISAGRFNTPKEIYKATELIKQAINKALIAETKGRRL